MEVCPARLVDHPRIRTGVDAAFQGLALVGFLLAVAMPRLRWLPITFVVIEFPVSFLYDRQLVEPYRHSYSAFPLVLFAVALVLTTLWGRLLRVESRGDMEPLRP